MNVVERALSACAITARDQYHRTRDIHLRDTPIVRYLGLCARFRVLSVATQGCISLRHHGPASLTEKEEGRSPNSHKRSRDGLALSLAEGTRDGVVV